MVTARMGRCRLCSGRFPWFLWLLNQAIQDQFINREELAMTRDLGVLLEVLVAADSNRPLSPEAPL